MTEDKKPFTVSDRRHFTVEGQTREGAVETPERPAPAGDRPEGAAAPDQGQAVESENPRFPTDLVGLVVSLATQTSLFLGDAQDDRRASGLLAARDVITLLEALQEKTKGNRTPDEERVLEGVLYELRMAYVARSRMDGA